MVAEPPNGLFFVFHESNRRGNEGGRSNAHTQKNSDLDCDHRVGIVVCSQRWHKVGGNASSLGQSNVGHQPQSQPGTGKTRGQMATSTLLASVQAFIQKFEPQIQNDETAFSSTQTSAATTVTAAVYGGGRRCLR